METQIKVCMLISAFPNEHQPEVQIGGAEKQAYNLSRFLSRDSRIQVFVISKEVNQYSDTLNEVEVIRLRCTYYPIVSPILYLLKGIREFYRIHKRYGIDIVHVHLVDLPLILGCLLKLMYNIKLYLKPGLDEFHQIIAPKEEFRYYFYKYLVLFSDKIQALNQRIIENGRIIGLPRHKIFYLPNGIDSNQFPYEFNEKKDFTITFVGRLEHQKRVDILIQALEVLKSREKQFVCKIIGEGTQRKDLEYQTRERGLEECVFFLGFQTHIKKFYYGSSVLVLPSLVEGFSNVLLEALSCGTPVIATDIDGNNDIIKGGVNGFLFPVNDYGALAEKIIYLIENPSILHSLSAGGRKLIEKNYDFTIFARKLYNIYRELRDS